MNDQAAFLPFHAINEFMRADFRLSVIRSVMNALPELPDKLANSIHQMTRKYVKVPGFRNSDKAPAMVKVLPMAKAFEKNADLVAAILAAWCEAHAELRMQVYELLKARNWKVFPKTEGLTLDSLNPEWVKDWAILPLNVDRTKVPGFYTHWPKGEDYEIIYQQFTETYPNSEASIDQVSLMAVWLSLRLPYQVDEELPGAEAPTENRAAE
jgi:hypothetical protein